MDFSPKSGDKVGLMCDMVAHKLSVFHNGIKKGDIEGIFGKLYPIVSLQGAIAGPAKMSLVSFEASSFKLFDWTNKSY
jgi:hypothetical protein